MSPEGTISVFNTPGLGYLPRMERIESLTVRKQVFRAD